MLLLAVRFALMKLVLRGKDCFFFFFSFLFSFFNKVNNDVATFWQKSFGPFLEGKWAEISASLLMSL